MPVARCEEDEGTVRPLGRIDRFESCGVISIRFSTWLLIGTELPVGPPLGNPGRGSARFDESIGKVNLARSGHPSPSGLGAGEDIFKDHVEREQQMIRMWDEWLKTKQEQDEQG